MAKIIDDETMENVCILAKLSLSGGRKRKGKAGYAENAGLCRKAG